MCFCLGYSTIIVSTEEEADLEVILREGDPIQDLHDVPEDILAHLRERGREIVLGTGPEIVLVTDREIALEIVPERSPEIVPRMKITRGRSLRSALGTDHVTDHPWKTTRMTTILTIPGTETPEMGQTVLSR